MTKHRIKMPETASQSDLRETVLAYLKTDQLTETLSLTENDRIQFHWADWEETCRFQKKYVFNNSFSCERYFQLSEELEALKTKPIWLKNRFKSILSSEYDLYNCYSDSRIRATWFDRDHEILMSYENESGPYVSLSSMRWMDKEIYSKFVYQKLLAKFMPMRKFRLKSNIPVKMSPDNNPLKEMVFLIHQISDRGILFKVRGLNHYHQMVNSSDIHMDINLKPFLDISNAGAEESLKYIGQVDFENTLDSDRVTTYRFSSTVASKYGNAHNFKTASDETFFFFVPYREFKHISGRVSLERVMAPFVTGIHEYFENIIKAA